MSRREERRRNESRRKKLRKRGRGIKKRRTEVEGSLDASVRIEQSIAAASRRVSNGSHHVLYKRYFIITSDIDKASVSLTRENRNEKKKKTGRDLP